MNIRVGQGGTLDPLAEGVLIIGVGDGTKMLNGFLSGSKEYKATGRLGFSTDTLDSTGVSTSGGEEIIADISHVTMQHFLDILPSFTGNISQMPPMYSALKHKGKRLYELARKGETVDRQPRNITIYKLEMLKFDAPDFELLAECSGGTYIRYDVVALCLLF